MAASDLGLLEESLDLFRDAAVGLGCREERRVVREAKQERARVRCALESLEAAQEGRDPALHSVARAAKIADVDVGVVEREVDRRLVEEARRAGCDEIARLARD